MSDSNEHMGPKYLGERRIYMSGSRDKRVRGTHGRVAARNAQTRAAAKPSEATQQ